MPNSVLQAGVSGRRYNRYNLPIINEDWSRGMVKDAPLDALPESAVYDATDFLLHQPARMMKRGGTSYAGPVMGSATYAAAVAFAEFPAAAQIIGVGDDGHLYKITAGTTTDVNTMGTAYVPLQNPVMRIGATSYLIIPANDGTSAPKKYDGTTVTAIGGSAPAGKYVTVYKSRLVLGNNSANPNRLFFSPTPDITTTWDTTNSWIDCDYAITGLASLSNAIIVFSQGHTERITGATPPPGSDMDRAPIGSVGCSDARSISVWNNNVVFANPRGVYLTNGSGFSSLTQIGGIETYWQTQLTGYDASTWTIATGIYRNYLYITVLNGSTLVDTLMCNIAARAWWRLTNVKARGYANASTGSEELYYADRASARVITCSGMFTPVAGNKNDANGTAVTPGATLRQVGAGPWMKHFGNARISYDMADAATDNPTLAVSVAPGLEAATFTAVSESPLAETSGLLRKRFTVGKQSQAVNIKILQTNASSKTEVYAMETDQRYMGVYAGGQ